MNNSEEHSDLHKSQLRKTFSVSSQMQKMMQDAQRMQDRLTSTRMLKGWEDALRRQENYFSSGVVKAMQDAQKMQERLMSVGMLKTWEDTLKRQENYLSSGVLKAMQDAQRMQDRLTSTGMLKGWEDALKRQENYFSSGVLKAMQDAQRMQERLMSTGISKIWEDALKRQESILSSGILKAIENAQSQNITNASALLNRITKIGEELSNVDLQINKDGSISGKGATFKVAEVENIIEACLVNAPNTEALTLETKIDNFLLSIAKQHPLITKLIVYIVLQFFVSVLATKYMSESSNFDSKALAKQIKKECQIITVSSDFTTNYRFVSTASLNVRENNSIKSRLIARLHFGQLVHIVQKKKNWTLVEYRNENGDVLIKGWVFTRYIKKFN